MVEVCRARGTRFERILAIKVPPVHLADPPSGRMIDFAWQYHRVYSGFFA
jgi:hypothetical protein